jgi:two-component system, OmpR family, phosphate regulon sensor histidine kinase PhoR
MKLTIRIKLLIGFALLLILSSLIQAFTFNIIRQYISAQIDSFQKLQAQRGEQDVENFFSTLSLDSFGLAYIVGRSNLGANQTSDLSIAPVANYIIKNKDYVRRITILSPVGKELMQFDQTGPVPTERLNYEVFSEPFKSAASGTTAISKVYFMESGLGPFIDMYSPAFGNDGKVIGVIKMQVSMSKLRERISNVRVGKGFIYVVDNEGSLIAHPDEAFVAQRPDISSRKIIGDALHNRIETTGDYTYVNEKNVQVVAQAVTVPGYNWAVVFEQPEDDSFGILMYIRNLFIATLIGSTLFLLVIAFLLSENLTRPIRKLQKAALQLENGEISTPLDVKSGDEIENLSHSFATMVNRLLQREALLKQEKRETDTILQSLTDGVVALDQQGQIIAFNKAAEQTTGFTSAGMVKQKFDDVLHFYDGQELLYFFTYNDQGATLVHQFKDKTLHMVNQKGEKVSISLTTSPVVFEHQRSGFIIAFHDISREQELEEMKLDFVSMAAHELRTPLTAIRGYASLLQMQNAKSLDQSGQELINRLVVSSENLGNLIENLLSVSRIERSAFSVDARPVDLSNTIKGVIDNVRPQATTKKQTITLLVPDELPVVIADVFRIGQVILNFVANAVNYTQEGGSITIKAERKDANLVISVSDTGRGIPPDALARLFTKFFRVSGALEQGAKGTGLGLYISKSIIEMHKGKIWVESEVGKGTTFAFSLPIAKPEDISAYEHAKTDLTAKTGQGMIVRKVS